MLEFLVLNGYYLSGLGFACLGIFCFLFLFKRVERHWFQWEIPLALLPGIAYWWLDFVNFPSGKSIANLIEPIFVGLGYGVLVLIRLVIASQRPRAERYLAPSVPVFGILLAVAVFFTTPPLPE